MPLLHHSGRLRGLPEGFKALWAARISTSRTAAWGSGAGPDLQDSSKTRLGYSSDPNASPTSDVGFGVEKEVKWGQNMPASGKQLKDELKGAGAGLAESIEMTARVAASKVGEAVESAKRAMGMQASKEMSDEGMGAAGKISHAPPHSKTGFGHHETPTREAAEAKYNEISGTEKSFWSAGEPDVNARFPDQAEVASRQSNMPEQQRVANEQLRREMRSGEGSTGPRSTGDLEENLHNKGP